MSPDGEAIVTGAGDETLRFWNVFSKTRSTKVKKHVSAHPQFTVPQASHIITMCFFIFYFRSLYQF